MTDHRTLANRLHEERLAAGKTQTEAARILGCTAQAISNWERGCTRIDCVSLFRLLAGYGTDICAFLRRCVSSEPRANSRAHRAKARFSDPDRRIFWMPLTMA